jgi:hypothetical protein
VLQIGDPYVDGRRVQGLFAKLATPNAIPAIASLDEARGVDPN